MANSTKDESFSTENESFSTKDEMVSGFSTKGEIEQVRQRISICPQDNPIWLELSVRDHLRFYGACRGLESEELKQRIDEYTR